MHQKWVPTIDDFVCLDQYGAVLSFREALWLTDTCIWCLQVNFISSGLLLPGTESGFLLEILINNVMTKHCCRNVMCLCSIDWLLFYNYLIYMHLIYSRWLEIIWLLLYVVYRPILLCVYFLIRWKQGLKA